MVGSGLGEGEGGTECFTWSECQVERCKVLETMA